MCRFNPRLVLIAILVVGLASCGGSSSDRSDPTGGDETTGPGPTIAAGDSTTTAADAEMPDLEGMTESEARDALEDLGVDSVDIQVDERESIEAPGTVVETVPSQGAVLAGSVTIIVAKAGLVPAFETITDVRDWAIERGIEVTEKGILDDEKAEGEVISTTPAEGERMTSEIVVEFATLPVIVPLADLEPAQVESCDGHDSGEAPLNGTSIQDSVMLYGDCVVEYDLGRDWVNLKATVGIADVSGSDAKVRLRILVDGREAYNKILVFGSSEEIEIDIADALRIRFETIEISDGYSDEEVVLGNVRRIGVPGEVPDPSTETTFEE